MEKIDDPLKALIERQRRDRAEESDKILRARGKKLDLYDKNMPANAFERGNPKCLDRPSRAPVDVRKGILPCDLGSDERCDGSAHMRPRWSRVSGKYLWVWYEQCPIRTAEIARTRIKNQEAQQRTKHKSPFRGIGVDDD